MLMDAEYMELAILSCLPAFLIYSADIFHMRTHGKANTCSADGNTQTVATTSLSEPGDMGVFRTGVKS